MSNLPFMGEMMECALCKKSKRSDPNDIGSWTTVDLDDVRYYVCPTHLKPDKKGYEGPWQRALKRLIRIHARR